MSLGGVLAGYTRIRAQGTSGLVVERCKGAIEEILSSQTLYAFAAAEAGARTFVGRAPAYAVSLPGGCADVVVRHAMRGGLLARMNTDLFLPPTRGLRELVNSVRLRLASVQTPEVIAYVTYRAGVLLRRSDVATAEVRDGHDLSVVLSQPMSPEHREVCLKAAGVLLSTLTRAGAHHPDLNLRNVLITWSGPEGALAHVLDVDRIRFYVPGDPVVAEANLARLMRSLRKWRDSGRVQISDIEMNLLSAASQKAGE